MNHTGDSPEPRRSARARAYLLMAFVTGLAACLDGPTEPGMACANLQPPTVTVATIDDLSLSDIVIAVRDAAERNTAALPSGAATRELRSALTRLSEDLATSQLDDACRAVAKVKSSLKKQADLPATLPDRAALQQASELVSAYLGSPSRF